MGETTRISDIIAAGAEKFRASFDKSDDEVRAESALEFARWKRGQAQADVPAPEDRRPG